MFHIIDDNEIIRGTTKAILSDAGYNSVCFKSGGEYIKHLNSHEFEKPVAVLSDITMPGISGYDLALEIRKSRPFQIIIFISGNADPIHNELATREVCLILNKPLHPKELLSTIRDVVGPCYKHLTAENKKSSKCENAELFKCPFCG